jgi:hypothetical protein
MTRRRFVHRDGKVVEITSESTPTAQTPDALVYSEVHFESRQLPRFWKNHGGGYSKDGKPQFESRHQAHEAARRMEGEEDVNCAYGEM